MPNGDTQRKNLKHLMDHIVAQYVQLEARKEVKNKSCTIYDVRSQLERNRYPTMNKKIFN